jgi:hypothetical protein
VTEEGISIDVKEEQPQKAPSRMLVTEEGISIDVNNDCKPAIDHRLQDKKLEG